MSKLKEFNGKCLTDQESQEHNVVVARADSGINDSFAKVNEELEILDRESNDKIFRCKTIVKCIFGEYTFSPKQTISPMY